MWDWKNMGVSIYFLFLCAIFSSGVWSKKHVHTKKDSGGKIVGGNNATISDYPYQAYLLLQKGFNYYQCGGSIISPEYILTAAHCVVGIQRATIRIGSTNSDSGGKQYHSFMFKKHPKYNSNTSDYDVALIRVIRNMSLDGTTAKTIPLPEENVVIPAGSNVTVTGWGTTTEGGQTSNNLMAVTVPVISNEECNKMMSGITDRMFCAGLPEGGKDSCQGDSGGPAVTDDGILRGVVSFGMGCAQPGYPGVYTNVTTVRTWIKQAARV